MSSTARTGCITCPFYRYHDGKRRAIGCEGYAAGTNIITRFDSVEGLTCQLEVFCEKEYKKCELYQMIYTAKYEEEPCDE